MKTMRQRYWLWIALGCLLGNSHTVMAQAPSIRFNQTWLTISQNECLNRGRQGLANIQYTLTNQGNWWMAASNQNEQGLIGISCITKGAQTQAYVTVTGQNDKRCTDLVNYLIGFISAQTAPPTSAVVRAAKTSFAANEEIVIEFGGFPGNQTDWIALCPAGAPANQATQSNYLKGYRQGSLKFSPLPAGSYEVRGYFNWQTGGYDIKARSGFTVAGAANPQGKAVDWGTTAGNLNLQGVGARALCTCPAGGSLGRVWGTDVYTHDSSICTAAVHSGLITKENGGTVAIEIIAGMTSYAGTNRYGVQSNNYGNWGTSFRFVR